MGPRPLARRWLLVALASATALTWATARTCATAIVGLPAAATAHTRPVGAAHDRHSRAAHKRHSRAAHKRHTAAAHPHVASAAHAQPLPCSREPLPPKPDGGAWICTFDDEFDASTGDATALNGAWVPQLTANSGFMTGGPGGMACYVNSPANIAVSGGALQLTARREDAPVNCAGTQTQYTAGMVSTYRTFSQTYGRFEIRARLPQVTVPGLQETLWLWPTDATRYGWWPSSGEIDFSEFYSQYAGLDAPYIHYNPALLQFDPSTGTNVQTASCPIVLSQYNDYALVWSPGRLTITVNGATCLVDNYIPAWGLTTPQPFDQPFFVLLTQALGSGSNAFNPQITPLPATTSIDYVRVWK